MSAKLVILDFDFDSPLYNPSTNERIESESGRWALMVENKQKFIDNLMTNKFKINDKVYSTFLDYLKFEEGQDLLNLEEGYYQFGNYTIQVYASVIVL